MMDPNCTLSNVLICSPLGYMDYCVFSYSASSIYKVKEKYKFNTYINVTSSRIYEILGIFRHICAYINLGGWSDFFNGFYTEPYWCGTLSNRVFSLEPIGGEFTFKVDFT